MYDYSERLSLFRKHGAEDSAPVFKRPQEQRQGDAKQRRPCPFEFSSADYRPARAQRLLDFAVAEDKGILQVYDQGVPLPRLHLQGPHKVADPRRREVQRIYP